MADYHPLISRAVAGLEKNTGEARRALYERARTALVAQLRGVTPALGESDITRERLALEEAIRKVEAETARRMRTTPPSRSEPAAPQAPPPPPVPEDEPPRQAALDRHPPAIFTPRRPAAAPEPHAETRPRFDTAGPAPGHPAAAAVESPRVSARSRLLGERKPPSRDEAAEYRGSAPPVIPAANGGDVSAHPLRALRDGPPGAGFAEAGHGTARADAGPRVTAHDLHELEALEPSFEISDTRPPAPRPGRDGAPEEPDVARPKRSLGPLLRKAAVYLGVFVIVAGLAGLLYWQRWTLIDLYSDMTKPAPEATREAPTSAPKITDRIEPDRPGAQPATRSQGAEPATGAQTAPVAQRVVLYEEDPANPQGKRYVGTAVWRTEKVAPAPGQPPEVVVRADVEIPERKISMTVSIRRNTDQALPASHTAEIVFRLPSDFPPGGISNVPGILMKQSEQTRGIPLAGLAVKVTNGFFLIGLSAVEADKNRNLQLLKERGWFDIPVVYNNNRRAILAIEKGTPGDRAFDEAFAAWGQ
jgi:hypothetical protein